MGKTVDTDSTKAAKSSKKKFDEALTKVIIRRLPPMLQEDQFLLKLAEIFPDGPPQYDYFRFCGSDHSFSPISFCRAYINFKNSKDILKFKEKLDGFIFDDGKGGQYPVVVEFAPFQGIPKRIRRRKDIKCGTIERDTDYLSFLETLSQEVEPLPSAEVYLEQQEANKQNMKDTKITTPLIEFIKMKRTSGKSRMSSQRSSSSLLTANEKKRKPGKDNGKTGRKNSYSEKPSRSQNENSKKGNEKKGDDSRSSRKFGKDQGEKKRQGGSNTRGEASMSGKSHDWKEKGEKEEKEKTIGKGRPASAKSWKETKSQNDYPRSSSSTGRPSSSYRTSRKERVPREPNRVGENVEKSRSSKNERSSEKNDERTPNKYHADSKDPRVRNKDRPAQAIYQPRSRPVRPDLEDTPRGNSGRPGNREQKEKHPVKGYRDNSSKDRDGRDSGRRPSRDGQKTRNKPNGPAVGKEP